MSFFRGFSFAIRRGLMTMSPVGRPTVGRGLTGKAVPDVFGEIFKDFVTLFETRADDRRDPDAGRRWVLGPEDGRISKFLFSGGP
jgi:hypothetical protein